MDYEIDFSRDGLIIMHNPKTIERYHQLKYDSASQPNCRKLGVFFAFSNKQFEEGYQQLVADGHIKDGDKVVRSAYVNGMFGTREGFDKLYAAYDEIDKKIKEECDPQEVYFYEYNNHESMINWDGDEEAIKVIIRIWGKEVAKGIKRYHAIYDIDNE